MNKEEKPYLYTNTEWEDLLDYNGMTWIYIDRFKELQQENKKYKEVIDKAIDYIKNNEYVNVYGARDWNGNLEVDKSAPLVYKEPLLQILGSDELVRYAKESVDILKEVG